MRRLIDADKLIDNLKTHFDALYKENGELLISDHVCNSEDVNDLIELVNKQPTAYDVDKVVEQLEKQREMYEQVIDEMETMRDDPYKIIYRKGKMRGFEYSKEVVRAGGIDE